MTGAAEKQKTAQVAGYLKHKRFFSSAFTTKMMNSRLSLGSLRRGMSLHHLDASVVRSFLRRRLMSAFEDRPQTEKGKLVSECKKGIVGLQHGRPVRNETLTFSSDQEYESAFRQAQIKQSLPNRPGVFWDSHFEEPAFKARRRIPYRGRFLAR